MLGAIFMFLHLANPALNLGGPGGTVLLDEIALVDPGTNTTRAGMDVLIVGDRIERVEDEIAPVPGALVVNGKGLFLCPGLIDAHVHFVDPATHGPLMIAHGVALVRDMGYNLDEVIVRRAALASGELVGPDMICAGSIVDGDPPYWPFSEACATPEAGREAVRKLKAAGVDFIKVYSRLRHEVYDAIVDECRVQAIPFAGHLPDGLPVRRAIEAGQRTIEHMQGVDQLLVEALVPGGEASNQVSVYAAWQAAGEAEPETLARALAPLVNSGVAICPTHVVIEGIASLASGTPAADPQMEFVSAPMKAFWGGEQYQGFARYLVPTIEGRRRALRALHDAGVTFIAGTDLANPHVYAGDSLIREMEIMQEAGVPAVAVLRAATSTPARVLGVEDRFGAVEPGRLASLVVLRANPLDDVGALRQVEGVFDRGEWRDRANLDALVEEARRAAAGPIETPKIEGIAPELAALRLEGDVVRRGTYEFKFGAFPAGTEDFVVTRRGEETVFAAITRFGMGGPKSSISTYRMKSDGAFGGATYRLASEPEKVSAYAMPGDALRIEARLGDEVQSVALAGPFVLSGPATSFTGAMLRNLGMGVGASAEVRAVSFGDPTWRMGEASVKVERMADADVTLSWGEVKGAHRYVQRYALPGGEVVIESWIDVSGLPLRVVMNIPQGKLEAVLRDVSPALGE